MCVAMNTVDLVPAVGAVMARERVDVGLERAAAARTMAVMAWVAKAWIVVASAGNHKSVRKRR